MTADLQKTGETVGGRPGLVDRLRSAPPALRRGLCRAAFGVSPVPATIAGAGNGGKDLLSARGAALVVRLLPLR